jgi:peroxiredoxin
MRLLGRSTWLALGAVLSLVLAACGDGGTRVPAAADPAPEFDLERTDGSRVRLVDLRGRFVLLDFWATWCPPCVAEIPELNAVWERVQGRDVEVLAVSVDELAIEELARWVREHEIAYPVALADLDLAVAYGGSEFPFHVLVGPDGNVLERLEPGIHDRRELLELIERHR